MRYRPAMTRPRRRRSGEGSLHGDERPAKSMTNAESRMGATVLVRPIHSRKGEPDGIGMDGMDAMAASPPHCGNPSPRRRVVARVPWSAGDGLWYGRR
jgi:hypothetical protein